MGQYWQVFNLDKKELLNPHAFGEGLKYREWVGSGMSVSAALSMLLTDGSSMGDGGGDTKPNEYMGRWIGDRVVVIGDYTHIDEYKAVYRDETYTDISGLIAPFVYALD